MLRCGRNAKRCLTPQHTTAQRRTKIDCSHTHSRQTLPIAQPRRSSFRLISVWRVCVCVCAFCCTLCCAGVCSLSTGSLQTLGPCQCCSTWMSARTCSGRCPARCVVWCVVCAGALVCSPSCLLSTSRRSLLNVGYVSRSVFVALPPRYPEVSCAESYIQQYPTPYLILSLPALVYKLSCAFPALFQTVCPAADSAVVPGAPRPQQQLPVHHSGRHCCAGTQPHLPRRVKQQQVCMCALLGRMCLCLCVHVLDSVSMLSDRE